MKARKLGRNPVRGVDLPPLWQVERRYLTHRQVADLAGATGPDDGVVVLLLGYMGLRWGELAAIRARRVAPGARRFDIAEANERREWSGDSAHRRRINGDGYPCRRCSVTDLASVWQPSNLMYGHLYEDELDAAADRMDEAATRILADSVRIGSWVISIT